MRHKKIFAAILIFAFIVRLIYALIVPIFEKPDEQAHFEYIKYIADNKRLPIQQEGQRSAEFFQPPFYQFVASFLLNFMTLFTQGIIYHIYFFRIVSALISILTLYLIYKITLLTFKNQNLSLASLIFAAFLPSHINMNTNVTNSNFGDLLSTLIIYLLLLTLTKGETLRNNLILGFIAGISLITRLSLIPAIITIPFSFVVRNYPDIKKTVKPLALIFIIAFGISSWNFIRNYNLYGDPLGINAVKISSPRDDIKIDSMFAARLVGWTFITFWAAFGRTNGVFIGNLDSLIGIIIFMISYLLLLLFTFSSIYGLYLFLKKYKKNKNILNKNQKKAFAIMIFHIVVLGFFFIALNLYDFQPQGRLFFPAISTIAIFFTLGIYNLFNEQRKFLKFYFIIFILINLASILSIVSHYYS